MAGLTTLGGLAATALPVTGTAQEAPKAVRTGWSLAKSGPNAALTDVTIRPNYDMWVQA